MIKQRNTTYKYIINIFRHVNEVEWIWLKEISLKIYFNKKIKGCLFLADQMKLQLESQKANILKPNAFYPKD